YFTALSPTCPRCGARVERRIAIRAVRKIAIIGSVLGIVLLWYAALLKEPEDINIGDIQATMNNALVRVQGRVVDVKIDEDRNSLRISIDDGTGDSLTVNAFNKLNTFREAFGEDMPNIKDRISVVGALNVSQAWGNSMFLSLPSRITLLEEYEVKDVNIGDISVDDEGELFRIDATVKEHERFTTNSGYILNRFVLGDNTGEIEMVLFSSAFDSLPADTRYAITKTGAHLQMLVEVSTYRGEPQVNLYNPSSPESVKIVSVPGGIKKEELPAALEDKNVSELVPGDVGGSFNVDASVESVGLGTDGVYLDLSGTDIDIYATYAQQENISNFSKLNDGGQISGPMKLVSSDFGPELRIIDISRVTVR
ncbi:MAG: hypothetical protein U9R36_05565, partial [Elusimicrobiota bacterium]|nr:hypothetical protein [Elusimicrobiota bacterium]